MSVLADIRLALRLLRRTPGLTAIALLSIALSVGATAVVFTAVKSVLIDPLPYAHAEELVQFRTDFANAEPSHGDWVFWNDTQELIRRTRTLQSIGIYRNAVFDLPGDSSTPPEALYGLLMTASLFPTLGASPMLGRNILPGEDQPGQSDEMILSYGLWTRRFHADRSVIGRTVKIDGRDCIVIGVMPPDFNFPLRRAAAHTPAPYVEFWAPLRITPGSTSCGMGAVARLLRGVALTQAQQDLASISAALAHEFPATNRDRALRMAFLRDRAVGSAGDALWLLMAAALMFLSIGCANVANLLLARGLARRREIAVRVCDRRGKRSYRSSTVHRELRAGDAGWPRRLSAGRRGVEDPAGGRSCQHPPLNYGSRRLDGFGFRPAGRADQWPSFRDCACVARSGLEAGERHARLRFA